jgi:hypothetical protein
MALMQSVIHEWPEMPVHRNVDVGVAGNDSENGTVDILRVEEVVEDDVIHQEVVPQKNENLSS